MENKWTAIKDKMPHANSWVFVCYDMVANDALGCALDIAYYDGVEWSIGNRHTTYRVNGKVTHWMKLPEFPNV